MKAPPTPGSLSLSSYNINDNIGMHDTYNPQTSSTGQSRHSDNYKNVYNYSESGENVAFTSTTSTYNETLDLAYNLSHKYVPQTLPSTSIVPTVSTESISVPSLNPSNTPNSNSRVSSYIVSIHCSKIKENKQENGFLINV